VYIIDVINGKSIEGVLQSTDSPYILKYTNSQYKQVLEACKKSIEDKNNYWNNQPEVNEPDFQQQVQNAKQKEKENPRQRFMPMLELCKYRLNKKIPTNLPFEERKKLFIQSSEWSGHIRQINNPKKESEITETNLQSEIEYAAIQSGIELQERFENVRFVKGLNEGYCELVLDKGNVKYEL